MFSIIQVKLTAKIKFTAYDIFHIVEIHKLHVPVAGIVPVACVCEVWVRVSL